MKHHKIQNQFHLERKLQGILTAIDHRGPMTTRQLSRICKISIDNTQRYLVRLRDRGLIKSEGHPSSKGWVTRPLIHSLDTNNPKIIQSLLDELNNGNIKLEDQTIIDSLDSAML